MFFPVLFLCARTAVFTPAALRLGRRGGGFCGIPGSMAGTVGTVLTLVAHACLGRRIPFALLWCMCFTAMRILCFSACVV